MATYTTTVVHKDGSTQSWDCFSKADARYHIAKAKKNTDIIKIIPPSNLNPTPRVRKVPAPSECEGLSELLRF